MSSLLLLIHTWIFFEAGCLLTIVGCLLPSIQEVVLVDSFALFISCVTYLSIYGIGEEYVRWTGYTFACAGFTYVSARVLQQSRTRSAAAAGLMAITIFTGAIVYWVDTDAAKYMLFVIGSGTYLASMIFVIWKEVEIDQITVKTFRFTNFQLFYIAYFTIVWSVYPIVYLLGPALTGVIDQSQEEIAYFVLEFPAKYGIAALSTSYEIYLWMESHKKRERILL